MWTSRFVPLPCMLLLVACQCGRTAETADYGPGPDSRSACWDQPPTCRLPVKAGTLKWTWQVPNSNDAPGPVVADRKGQVILATPWALYALRGSDGKLLWTVPSDIPFAEYQEGFRYCPPVVGPSGNLYVVMDNGDIRSYDAEGHKRWSVVMSGPYSQLDINWRVAARPVISAAGVMYVAGNKVEAFDGGSGKRLWEQVMPSRPGDGMANPVLAGDLLLVPLRWPPRVVALEANSGKERWSTDLSQNPGSLSTLVVDRDLALVIVSLRTMGIRISDGALLWTQQLADENAIFPGVVTPDGQILAAHLHNKTEHYMHTLASLTREGKVAYELSLVAGEQVQFVIGPLGVDGTLYISLRHAAKAETVFPDRLLGYSVHDRSITTLAELPGPSDTPVLLPDGTLVFGSMTDDVPGKPVVYAVQTQSAGLARGGWPRSGHDNQSSGDVATP